MNRGSEWNKWDLHVHTKYTNKNDQFTSATFDDFCIEFFKRAVEKNIKVIGITDYFSIENYLKIKEFLTRIDEIEVLEQIKEEIKKIYLIPNIELRMLPSTDSGKLINIHCLFNPDYIDNLEDDFFSTLEFNGYKMTKTGLIRLGKNMKPDVSNDDLAYEVGINNFVISPDILESLFKKNNNLRKNTITVVSNNSTDGASGLRKHYELFENDNASSLDGVRKKVYHLSDMIFSSRKGDIDYFLGNKGDSKELVIQKCGSMKPCIHGCDAHSENKLFEPDLSRYCWIKAIPTFEGLKQVLYEPDRVKIQEDKPDKKVGYEVIKSIKILNTNNVFTQNEIYFNSNLNSIIGGKSSGKSLLLYLLAKTVLSSEKFDEISKYKNFVNYDELPKGIECEVLWEDGTVTKLSSNENKRHIEYIPQLFLNNIAEDKKNELFNQTINDLLYKKNGYKGAIDLIYKSIDEKKISLTREIEKYFTNKSELKRLEIELTTLGDKNAIEILINSFREELKELKFKSSLTQDDENTMKAINELITLKKNEKILLEKEIILNNSINKVTNELGSKIERFITDEFNLMDIDDNHKEILKTYYENLSKNIIQSIDSFQESNPLMNDTLLERIKLKDEEIEPLIKSLEPYNDKILDQKKYLFIEKLLKDEQLKLDSILLKEKEINNQKSKLDIKKFIDIYKELLEIYNTITSLNEPYKTIGNDLELITHIDFNLSKFYDNFSYFVTKNQSMDKIFSDVIFDVDSNYLYKKENHIENIEEVLNKIFSGNVKFNKSKTLKEMTKSLLDDNFDITYDLKQGDDLLNHMSPGKKGIVLFQLFLEVSSSKVPILIDQPEDNLDNRTVYNTLNEFIKNKKIDRQIIMVSHNSNLVVSTDSENIIVANQNGQNSSYPRFEYINGALEETKKKDLSELNELKKQGIREHVCEILEGGVEAFKKREEKYNI
ncbi:TrlF family AAA-like ATPase [Aliarcobacter butzleri]|uniref:TrlF family AAA-like ATPase n=1 Tax=Aliarcobacter butzleri TaxID=28197 RepID=UPI003AF80505